MSREIGKLKVKVAVGCFGGAVALEIFEACDQIKEEIKDYGQWMDDFFHFGTDIPKDGGVYIFEGVGYFATDENGNVDETWYEGVFTKEKINHKDNQITVLWSLLDDISTAGDMFKPEQTQYFAYVNKKCEQRSEVANSFDGKTLTIKEA